MNRLSTKHVLLGLMMDRPSYGYRLQQQIADQLDFLELAPSAIYKLMGRLEEDGWIAEAGSRPTGTRRGAPRILYQATPEGVSQFKKWIAEPSERGLLRDELQAKLAVSQADDLPQLLALAESQAQECLDELAKLTRPSLVPVDATDLPWDKVARIMVDDFSARWLEALVDWLDAISEVIEQRIADSGRAAAAS